MERKRTLVSRDPQEQHDHEQRSNQGRCSNGDEEFGTFFFLGGGMMGVGRKASLDNKNEQLLDLR